MVIPAHEAEQRIGAAVRSALDQTLPPAEVLVVDDGSRDGTAAAADAAGATVIRLSVNRGAAAARNVGLAAAGSDRVAYLDADDLWLPEHLSAIDAAFAAVPQAAVAFSGLVKIGPRHRYRVPQEVPSHQPIDLLALLLRRNQVQTSATAVAREAVLALGGMRSKFRIAHDYDLWLRLAVSRVFVRAVGWTAHYHVHSGQLTSAYMRLLEESWQARFDLLAQLPAPVREHHAADVRVGWEHDLRRSWTRRVIPELDFLLEQAGRIPGSEGTASIWRRRRGTMRWLRWPLRLWDAMPRSARFHVARWRGREAGELL